MRRSRLPAVGVALAVAAALLASVAFAQPAAYRIAPPPGWTRSVEADTLIFAAPGEPAGTASLMLLPVKPLGRDFDAQFARERAVLERAWGLRDAQPAPPQRGRSAAGEFAASFASYASDRGDRYVAWHALGNQGAFALVVFVANSSGAFNRHRMAAAETFNRLALTDEAQAVAARSGSDAADAQASRQTTPQSPAPAPLATAAGIGSRLVGTWSTFSAPANGPTLTRAQVERAGFGSWWEFRADGTYRQVRAYPLGAMSWTGVVNEGHWSLNDSTLTVQQTTTSSLAALDDPPSQRRAGKPGTFKALSFRLAFGPQGELLLSDPPIELRLPPAR